MSESNELTAVSNPGNEHTDDPVNEEPERHCWVCFATDEDDETALWVRPCLCKGTAKWVHQKCLQRWVDEKQRGNAVVRVCCPQCNTAYIIVYPYMGSLVVILDTVNSVIYRVCPFLAAGLLVGSVYWVAVTYGAVTVMQIMGQDEGQELLEMSDPLFLLLALPAIPTTLVLGKMIQWEDAVLMYFRRLARKVTLVKYIFPSLAICSSSSASEDPPPLSDSMSATRILCSALIFPTVATLVGNVLFRSVKPHFQRTALGAITFLAFKGALKLYHKQQLYVRKCKRVILDYDEAAYSPASPPTND